MKKIRGRGGINDFVCNLMINCRIASNKKGGAVFLFCGRQARYFCEYCL